MDRRRRSPDRASNSSPRTAKHIGSEIGLPRLDVLPGARQHRPSASGLPTLVLPQSQGISSQSQSQSLSLYLKNESEMKFWNESLSLFKNLSDSLFLNVIVCCFCLALFITLLIFSPVFGFICWCWCWCWWDTLNCLLVLVLVSFGENREIQLIGFIWLALVLWLGVVGHWGLSMDRGMGPGKMHMGCVAVC